MNTTVIKNENCAKPPLNTTVIKKENCTKPLISPIRFFDIPKSTVAKKEEPQPKKFFADAYLKHRETLTNKTNEKKEQAVKLFLQHKLQEKFFNNATDIKKTVIFQPYPDENQPCFGICKCN